MDLSKACSLLGTSPSEDLDTAKKKYKKLASKLHPDVNKDPNAEANFKELNQAWEIFEASKTTPETFNPFSFFQTQRIHLPKPIRLSTNLSFQESVLGCIKEFVYQRNTPCTTCHGYGKVHIPNKCKKCNGQGTISERYHNMQRTTTCNECYARDTTKPCTNCSGRSTAISSDPIQVNIPAGAVTGNTLKLQGMGNVENSPIGLHASDVFIDITVEPHPSLTFEPPNVLYFLPLSFKEAIQGTTKIVPTIDGEQTVTIPPLSKHNEVIFLDHLGMKRESPQKVIFNVSYPDNLTQLVQDYL